MDSSNGYGRCMYCYGYMTTSGGCGCQNVLIDEMLTYVPITRHPIKLNLTFRGELKPLTFKVQLSEHETESA